MTLIKCPLCEGSGIDPNFRTATTAGSVPTDTEYQPMQCEYCKGERIIRDSLEVGK